MGEKIVENLKNVEGLSVSDGINFCGNETAYLKFITSFYKSIEKKAADMDDAYKEGDFVLYTVKVHALKSSARIAGIISLSELARKLEEAGSAGDYAYIREKHDDFISRYKSYIEKLSILKRAEEDADKPIIAEDELKDAYKALDEYIQGKDYDAVEVILEEVKKYRLPQKDRIIIYNLDDLLKNMDWDEMNEVIKSV